MLAAEIAFGLARDIQAEIGLIYVIDRTREIVNADLGITPEHSEEVMQQEAQAVMIRYVRLYNHNLRIFHFTPVGSPEKEILRVAKEWQADMIVMGTHGRSGLQRMLTGSVAEFVIRHATVPVMITPPGMVSPAMNAGA
jgi:nucleotide-binding universal stress UspA family protein